jgi:uncharacterized membrane protein YoaK (UPF0700 family)
MFRHQGKSRTQTHNKRIASVLSFVAGIVNVVGFLTVKRLTTNLTGHFAFLVYDVSKFDFSEAYIYFLFVIVFLLGSFTSGILIESVHASKKMNIFVLPTFIESLILIFVAFSANTIIVKNPNIIAYLLLFAMGLQNSFVTKISNAVVRTTHLTGLFTDLGIDLALLFFPTRNPLKKNIISNIILRFYIIGFFFIGVISGGLLYTQFGVHGLLIGPLILISGLYYDNFRFNMLMLKRKTKANFNMPTINTDIILKIKKIRYKEPKTNK